MKANIFDRYPVTKGGMVYRKDQGNCVQCKIGVIHRIFRILGLTRKNTKLQKG